MTTLGKFPTSPDHSASPLSRTDLIDVGRSKHGGAGNAGDVNTRRCLVATNELEYIKTSHNPSKQFTHAAMGDSSSLRDNCNFLQAASDTLINTDEDLSDVELIKGLKGKKHRNILSFVEDSVADTLPISNWSGVQSKNKRKSLAEVTMPYDANDKETLAWKQHQITQNSASKRRKSTVGCGGTNGLSKQRFDFGESNNKKSMFGDISSFVSPINMNKKLKSHIPNKFGWQRPSFAATAKLLPSKIVDFNKNLDISLYSSLKLPTLEHCIRPSTKTVTELESRLMKLQNSSAATSSSDCNSDTEGQRVVSNSISAIISRLADEGPSNSTGAGTNATLSLSRLLGTPTRRLDLSSLAARNSDEDADQLSDTQPANSVLLAGVIAFVDVRSSDGSNRSSVVRDRLVALGATVLSKLTNDVTHVVFRDGLKSTFQTSRRRGLFLVSCAWLDECQRAGARLPEAQFPSVSVDKYSDPLFLSRLRKGKSMQPKEFSELEQAAEEKLRRRRLRLAAAAARGTASPTTGGSPCSGGAGPCSVSPGPPRVPPYGGGGSASPSGAGNSSDAFEDDLDLGKNINSPLYGIAHLLTPKRDRSPIGSEDTTRENSPQPRSPHQNTAPRSPWSSPLKNCGGGIFDTQVPLNSAMKNREEGEELKTALGRRNSIVKGLTLERRTSANDQLRDKLRTKFLTHVRKSLLTGSVKDVEEEGDKDVSTASSSLLTGRRLLRPVEGSGGLQSSSADSSLIPGSQQLLQSLNVTPCRAVDRRRSCRLAKPLSGAEASPVSRAPRHLAGGEVGNSPVTGVSTKTAGCGANINTAPVLITVTTNSAGAGASDGGFTSDDDDYSTPLAARMYNKFLARKPLGQDLAAFASPVSTQTPAAKCDTLAGGTSSGSSVERVSPPTTNLNKLFNEKYARRGSRLSTAYDDTVLLPNSLGNTKGAPITKSTFNDTFVVDNRQGADCHADAVVRGVLESTRNANESTVLGGSHFTDGSPNDLSSIKAFPCHGDESGGDSGNKNSRRKSRRINVLPGAGTGGPHASDGGVFLNDLSPQEGSSCGIVDVPAKNISNMDALLYSTVNTTLDGKALLEGTTSALTIPTTSVVGSAAGGNVSSCTTQGKGKKRRPLLKSDAFDAVQEDLIVPLTPPLDGEGVPAKTNPSHCYDVLRTNSLNKKSKTQRSVIKTKHVTGQEPMPLPRALKRKVLDGDSSDKRNRKRSSLTSAEEGSDESLSASATEGEASPVEKTERGTKCRNSVRIMEPGSSRAESYDDSYEAFDMDKKGRKITNSSKKAPSNTLKSRRLSSSRWNPSKKSQTKPPATPRSLEPATGTSIKVTASEGPASRGSRPKKGATQHGVAGRRGSSASSRSGCSVEARGDGSRGRRQRKCSRSLVLEEGLPGICLTSVHSSEVEVLYPIIESLGGFNVKTRANSATTHMVSGQGARRTVNMLLACLHGAKLVTTDWVYSSLQQERWVDEAPFAVQDFSPTAQAVAVLKQSGLPVQLLAGVGAVFVHGDTAPSPADILELLSLAGGQATRSLVAASVILWPQTAPVTAALEKELLRHTPATGGGGADQHLPREEEEGDGLDGLLNTKQPRLDGRILERNNEASVFTEGDGLDGLLNTKQPRLDGRILERIIASSKFTAEDEPENVEEHYDDTVLLAGNEDSGDTGLNGGPGPCSAGKQRRPKEGLASLEAGLGDTRTHGLLAGSSVVAPIRSYSSMSVDYPPCVSRSQLLFAAPSREVGNNPPSKVDPKAMVRSRLSSVREVVEEECAEGRPSSNNLARGIKGVVVVHEKWFLDSVQYFRVQPFENYLLPHVEEARERVQKLGKAGCRVTFKESSDGGEKRGQDKEGGGAAAARAQQIARGRRRSSRVSLPAR